MESMTDDAPGTPKVRDEWMEDREVFSRDHEQQLYVSPDARKHWSDRNPTKFTPETALKIIQYVGGSGCTLETCAAAAGISKQTLFNWLKTAERADDADGSTEELRAWKRHLDEAEALLEARCASGIIEAGSTSWQAFAWFLERRWPHRWAKRETTMHANPDGSPLAPPQIALVSVDPRDVTAPKPSSDDGDSA